MTYEIDSGICVLSTERCCFIVNCLAPRGLSSNSAAAIDQSPLHRAGRHRHRLSFCSRVVAAGRQDERISFRQLVVPRSGGPSAVTPPAQSRTHLLLLRAAHKHVTGSMYRLQDLRLLAVSFNLSSDARYSKVYAAIEDIGVGAVGDFKKVGAA